MICVIDSCVWVSGLQFDGTPLNAIDIAIRNHSIAICPPILRELRMTLSERFNWSQARIDGIFAKYIDNTIKVETTGRIRGICRDPNDDMIIECAIMAKADLIISGDKDLLSLGSYEGIRILTPREFLDLYANDKQLLP